MLYVVDEVLCCVDLLPGGLLGREDGPAQNYYMFRDVHAKILLFRLRVSIIV